MARLQAAFGDRLYVELQRHPGEDGQPEAERLTEQRLCRDGLCDGHAAGRDQ